MKRGSLPLWAGTVVFALAGLGFLWGTWALAEDVSRFLAHSRPATGTIVSYRTESSTPKDGGTTVSHYPTISYPDGPGGALTFEADQTLDPEAHPVGDTVDILVSTDGRHHDEINSPDSLWVNPILLAFFGVLCLGAALLIYFLMIREVEVRAEVMVFGGFLAGALLFGTVTWAVSGDSLWLTAHGQRTMGTVVTSQGAPEVEFTAADGQVYHRQTSVGGDHLPARGTALPVLYDPAHPGRARAGTFDDLWFATALAGGFTGLCAVVALGVFFGVVVPGRRNGARNRNPGFSLVGDDPKPDKASKTGLPIPEETRARLDGLCDRVIGLFGRDHLRTKPLLRPGEVLLNRSSTYEELFDGAAARCLLALNVDPGKVRITHASLPVGTVGTQIRYGDDGSAVITLEDRLGGTPFSLALDMVQALVRYRLWTEHGTQAEAGLGEVASVFFGFGLLACGGAVSHLRFAGRGLPVFSDRQEGPFTVPEYAYLLARWAAFGGHEVKTILSLLDPEAKKPLRRAQRWLERNPGV